MCTEAEEEREERTEEEKKEEKRKEEGKDQSAQGQVRSFIVGDFRWPLFLQASPKKKVASSGADLEAEALSDVVAYAMLSPDRGVERIEWGG